MGAQMHAVKDRKGLIGTEDTQNFDKHAVGLWADDEKSVRDVRLPDFVLRNEVSDGMRNIAFGCSMFESRTEDVNTAIS
jgi:hypothetical protein